MLIASFGCSLTFGTDLPDDGKRDPWPKASLLTWPALIAQRLGIDYNCHALGGSGNLCIADRVLRYCSYYPENFFIINWTFTDRFDYSDPQGQHYGTGKKDYLTLRPGGSDENTGFYFRNIHSQYRDKFSCLLYINTVVERLNANNTKFLMTSIDDSLFCQTWHAPPHLIELQAKIKPSVHWFEGRNFLDWAHIHGMRISESGHPLQESHAAAAELMISVVESTLHSTKSACQQS